MYFLLNTGKETAGLYLFKNNLLLCFIYNATLLAISGPGVRMRPYKNTLSAQHYKRLTAVFLLCWLLISLALLLFFDWLSIDVLWLFYAISVLQINQINQFINSSLHSTGTPEEAVPFFNILRMRKTLQTYLLVLPWVICAIVAYVFWKMQANPLEGAGMVFIGVVIPAYLLAIPLYAVKQQSRPSFWQRCCRRITLWILSYLVKSYEQQTFEAQSKLFTFWLSHPGAPYPQGLIEQLPDKEKIFWQETNPSSKFSRPLDIGSRAHEALVPVKIITPLFRAVLEGDLHQTAALLPQSQKEINRSLAVNGNTLLHVAVWNRNTDLVRLLLNQPGIVENIKNHAGKTPLDLAKERHFTEIAALLELNA